MESTITKIIHWGAHRRFELAEESGLEDRSMDRLCSLRNRKKKNKEFKTNENAEAVGHHQVYQYRNYRSPWRREEI